MPSLGRLFVNIGANTTGLQTGANKAESRLTKLRGTMNRVAAGATRLGGAMGAAGAAIITAAVNQSSQAVTQQTRLARSLGTTNKEVAGLTSAFKAYGLQQEDVSDAINSITDRAQDAASGMESMADDFKLVGMGADDLRGKQPAELFRTFAESIRNTEDPAKRTAAAVRILGDDVGRKLLPLLMEGEQGIDKFVKQAQDMGLAVSQVDARQIERANIAMSRVSDAVAGLSRSLTVELAPIIEGVADGFSGAASEAGGFGRQTRVAVDEVARSIGAVLDVIDGIGRTFTVAGQAVATQVLEMKEDMLSLSELIWSGPVDAINDLIWKANLIPGVEIEEVEQPDFVKDLRSDMETAGGAVEEGKKAMNETLMEPMPSDAMDQWLEDQRKKSREAADSAIAERERHKNEVMSLERQQSAQSAKLSEEEREREQQRRKQNLERLKKNMATERETEVMNFEKRMEWLKEARESELVTEMEFFKRMQALKMGHERKMTQIDSQGLTEREKFQQKSMSNQVAQVAGSLQQMTSSVARENKAMFRLNQIAGIASATISAYEGFNKALAAYPPPLSYGMAAAQLAAGMAKVSAIKSQSFSKGGGSGGGGGGAPAQTGARSTQSGTGAGEGGASGPTTMINLQGDSFGRDQVRDLLDRINEEGRDGGRLVIN